MTAWFGVHAQVTSVLHSNNYMAWVPRAGIILCSGPSNHPAAALRPSFSPPDGGGRGSAYIETTKLTKFQLRCNARSMQVCPWTCRIFSKLLTTDWTMLKITGDLNTPSKKKNHPESPTITNSTPNTRNGGVRKGIFDKNHNFRRFRS